ncbi:MAG: hypothetical protein QM690_12805 [Sphingobium sp.]
MRIDPVNEWNPLVVCWNPVFNEEWKAGLPFQSAIVMQIARSISDTTRSRRAPPRRIQQVAIERVIPPPGGAASNLARTIGTPAILKPSTQDLSASAVRPRNRSHITVIAV